MQWLPAPGKLNLFLHVLARRADGMHELQTAYRLIDRCDRVGVSARDDGAIRFAGVFGDQNLCVKAAEALKTASKTSSGCEIALEKVLPVGGGLGGGSSDAATVLLALNRLWNLNWKREKLIELGLKLGADVPFFLYGRNALGEGVGERLSGLELEPAWYLVLTPQVSVSTREIFSDAALTRDAKPLTMAPFLSGQGRNDLEPIALRRYPEIAAQLAWLRERSPPGCFLPRMTGSGACVFAEFSQRQDAVALQRELPAGMRGFVARGLERHPLHDWAGSQ
ncbi:MAG: 4-(cytidine 5'-diphospho)-2-C-methyl-D-erythritol kinase [Betaproteobacteria bacterium]|nr:4-(cytidine 5'-diphospho)-2-C-methyl-D-erythritol kinase [Betaproteobacteria bacterium]